MKNKYLLGPTKDTTGMVSVSQIIKLLKCPKAWTYSYMDKLRPRVDRPFLSIGKLVHKGMEAAMLMHYQYQISLDDDLVSESELQAEYEKEVGSIAIKAAFFKYLEENTFLEEEMQDQYQNLEDALAIFHNAYEQFNFSRYEVVEVWEGTKAGWKPAIELHFHIPMQGSRGLHGFIDAVLRDKETGHIWIVDYKFRRSLEDEEAEQFNLQNAVYMYASRLFGVEATGTLTWQHLNTPPSIPSVNKDGKISKAKIKTTWPVYEAFCKINGQDPLDYATEMIPKLAEIEWSRPMYEYRNEATLDLMWEKIIIPATKLIKSKKKSVIPALFAWNCKGCEFTTICQAELRDYDLDFIRMRDYTTTKTDEKQEPMKEGGTA